MKHIAEVLKLFIIAFLLVFLVNKFLFAAYTVSGDSMLPSLKSGDKLIVNVLSLNLGRLERNDIIVFNHENDRYIKRVIGLPNDKIEYRNDQLYVNGEIIPEPYLTEQRFFLGDYPLMKDFNLESLTGVNIVPKDKYFVLGDNRTVSSDSREFGFVDRDDLIGIASLSYFPLKFLNR